MFATPSKISSLDKANDESSFDNIYISYFDFFAKKTQSKLALDIEKTLKKMELEEKYISFNKKDESFTIFST